MTDFLDDKRKEIQARMKELRPLVDEFRRLEAAERALSGVAADGSSSGSSAGSTATAAPRRRTTRRARAGAATRGAARRGRPRGSGTRAAQALELVKKRPGITIPELAQEMGIQQNYLYRVMPSLAEDGKVTKSGRGWHPRANS